ncbi:MbcA/ParS/Xre antitoxin family protein [uncultured Pseudoalteromonas sp.]|uniref:MbcA/ParS/Xre antitoxin family protein n=1 Tax=uncultured Pseudoalteromonas sp. TaxID=114053 RepID=UPI00338F7695
MLEPIFYLLGIYKSLGVLFSERAQAKDWLEKPNATFNGSTALGFMLLGNTVHLREVRCYLGTQL